jgi:catechol 2,3-dioxygenase-like lactoylglutathione lyase family enzyme
MWGANPFSIDDNYAMDVQDLTASHNWYKEKLGLKEAKLEREDDSGRPFVDLQISQDGGILTLVELTGGTAPKPEHVIFTSNHLEKTRSWMEGRGVTVEPVTNDSGGNQFFCFRDLDGNRIEVCKEPG